MVLMKKQTLLILNIFIFILQTIIDIILIIQNGFHNDGLLIIVLAILCFIIYFFGSIFPNRTVDFIYNLSRKIYKKSDTIQLPTLLEAKQIFQNRLIYLLLLVNILLILFMIIVLF